MEWLNRIKQYLKNINFFNDDTNDEHKKRNEILSTRLYIIVLIIIFDFIYSIYIIIFSNNYSNYIKTYSKSI